MREPTTQRSLLAGLVLLVLAPLAPAVPDADGNLVSEPAPDLSEDSIMAARLNYNVGYERFEKALQRENAGSALRGAAARESQQAVRQGLTEARERFRAATQADPGLKEAWNLIGYTSRRLGDYEESLVAYDKALQLQPGYPEAIEYRAELFLLTGRLTDVRAAYHTLRDVSPSYAGVLRQSMQDWVAAKSPAPGVTQADRAAFAAWVATLQADATE